MAPTWNSLGEEYAGSSSVLIGDVDCTASGEELCKKKGIAGYPTIKYYVDGEEKDYQGGRDFDALKSFVEENLEVKCLLDNQEGCSDKEKKYIVKMKEKGADKINTESERLNKMKGESMKPELKQWLNQRLRILSQLGKSDQEL